MDLWFEAEAFCGSNKTPLLCNGGGRICWKHRELILLDFKFTGRGGIGGGEVDIESDEEFSLHIGRVVISVCKCWSFEFEWIFC